MLNFENDLSHEQIVTGMTMNDFKALNILQNITSLLVPEVVNQSIHFSQFALLLSDNSFDCLSRRISVS